MATDRQDTDGQNSAKRHRAVLLATTIIASAVAAGAATTGAMAAPGAETAALEEIVVTATRREEKIQDIPMSVTALGGAALERMGADNFEDYVRTVPGLTYNSGGANTASFAIRGITTTTTPGNPQSPVAIYIDDLPALDSFGAIVTPDLRLFDVNRVEVLRGPQGTLFGSGALGGAIRVITNKPDSSAFAARIEATTALIKGGDSDYRVNGMINMPVVEDKLALRAVGYYRRDGGWVDNSRTGANDVNRQESYGGRVMARLTPTDDLAVTATVVYQNDKPKDAPYSRYDSRDYVGDAYVPQQASTDFAIYNMAVDYDLGFATLTSSTTYSARNQAVNRDYSGLVLAVFGPFGVTGTSPLAITGETKTFAQEVRLASSDEGRLRWQVGGLYLRHKRSEVEDIVTPGAGAILGAIGFPSDTLFTADIGIKSTEKALFGEVSYKITDQLTATAGLRAFKNSQNFATTSDGVLAGGPSATLREKSEDSLTPKFALAYEPQKDLLIYAQAAKGYRVGQANLAVPQDPVSGEIAPEGYDPDSLWNYELGLKSSWLDNRLVLNAAVFYIDWQDIQLEQHTLSGFAYINNAGTAHSKGLELEATVLPLPWLEAGTAFTYTRAELDSVEAGVNALPGDRLPGTPRVKVASYLQAKSPLSDSMDGYLRLEHQYAGKAYNALNNPTALMMGGYHLVNLRAGIVIDNIEVAAFVDNLAGSRGLENAVLLPNGPSAVRVRPRSVGLTLRATF